MKERCKENVNNGEAERNKNENKRKKDMKNMGK